MDSLTSDEEAPPSVEKRASQVNFDIKGPEKPRTKINRDLTPFPKELHSKAMQWRAARAAAASGGGAVGNTEVGVVLRSHGTGKHLQKRSSLLKALDNPLDEVSIVTSYPVQWVGCASLCMFVKNNSNKKSIFALFSSAFPTFFSFIPTFFPTSSSFFLTQNSTVQLHYL